MDQYVEYLQSNFEENCIGVMSYGGIDDQQEQQLMKMIESFEDFLLNKLQGCQVEICYRVNQQEFGGILFLRYIVMLSIDKDVNISVKFMLE